MTPTKKAVENIVVVTKTKTTLWLSQSEVPLHATVQNLGGKNKENILDDGW